MSNLPVPVVTIGLLRLLDALAEKASAGNHLVSFAFITAGAFFIFHQWS